MAQSIFSQQDFVKWDGIKIEINQKTQGYAKSCNEYQESLDNILEKDRHVQKILTGWEMRQEK